MSMQWCLLWSTHFPWPHKQFKPESYSQLATAFCRCKRPVNISGLLVMIPPCLTLLSRLCAAVLIALPAATPKELINDTKFAFGGFVNCESSLTLTSN
jgi:hypothetical protein